MGIANRDQSLHTSRVHILKKRNKKDKERKRKYIKISWPIMRFNPQIAPIGMAWDSDCNEQKAICPDPALAISNNIFRWEERGEENRRERERGEDKRKEERRRNKKRRMFTPHLLVKSWRTIVEYILATNKNQLRLHNIIYNMLIC